MRLKDITIEELVEIIRNIVKDEIRKLFKEDVRTKIQRLMRALKR